MKTRQRFALYLRKGKRNFKKQLFRRKPAPYIHKELDIKHIQSTKVIGFQNLFEDSMQIEKITQKLLKT